ncbi:MAG: lytic murein transglycosylase [Xanthobacteraceae bacterium]|nr:lytic murein transglycosylase [Xanthobacteraceae bacterium]
MSGVEFLTRATALGAICLALGACASDPATTQTASPIRAPNLPGKQANHPTHPQMSPQAISSAAADFRQCIGSLAQQAQARGISHAIYVRETRDLEPDMKILESMDRQPEFTKAVWDYVDQLVAERRINQGREMFGVHRATFQRIEQTYGVDPYVVAAIWGIESNFGKSAGDRDVIRSTATLACIGRRQEYFRAEFLAAMEIVAHGDISRARLKGSWAGAFGQTQFMPTTFKRLAVDFNGDGRKDLVDTVADALASTANNLSKNGWQRGISWGYEVTLPRNFNYKLANKTIKKSAHEWASLGVRRVRGQALPQVQGYILAPAGARGPAFLMTRNFEVILRYNPADAYALAIGHLADRIRGGGPFEADWPRGEQVLSRAERVELQQRLSALGFYNGEDDGKFDDETKAALLAYQQRSGITPDAFATVAVLERMRQGR